MLLTEKRNNPSDRFEYVYEQGGMDKLMIIVDKMTGVNYLLTNTGITPLLNADGSVVTTQLEGTW